MGLFCLNFSYVYFPSLLLFLSIIIGAPKVFPIWFTSTGEIYSDWSILPGGSKLQAHLKEVYDKGGYLEYLEIVKRILDEEWNMLITSSGGADQVLNASKGVENATQIDLEAYIFSVHAYRGMTPLSSQGRRGNDTEGGDVVDQTLLGATHPRYAYSYFSVFLLSFTFI